MHFSDEQVQRAREVSLFDFIRTNEGWTIQKVGNFYTTKEHDSLRILSDEKTFFWNSRGLNGHNVIDWLQKTRNMSFTENIRLILGEDGEKHYISEYNCLSDSIQFTHQRNVYIFTSSVASNYKFELSDVSNDVYFKMFIYNADMEELKYAEYQANGENVIFELKPNLPYYIVVEQQKNKGHYLMSYGIANEN